MSFFTNREQSPVLAQIAIAGHQGIHNFTLGTLTTYFRLETAQAEFINGILILDGLPGSARRKVFVFKDWSLCDQNLLINLQRTAVIYSIHRLDLPKESAFRELAYDLPDVFNRARYPNARKRHKRLVQPVQRLLGYGISHRLLTSSDLPAIQELHSLWCEWKLAQPKTFQMMFPKRRYLACVEMAIARPNQYMALGAFDAHDALIGARALYLDGQGSAFDLACFANTWGMYSNFSEDFYYLGLASLHGIGCTYLNCGATLTKSLGAFKGHWPHRYVQSWAYSHIKGCAA